MEYWLAIVLIGVIGLKVTFMLIIFIKSRKVIESKDCIITSNSDDLIDMYIDLEEIHPDQRIPELKKWREKARLNHQARHAKKEKAKKTGVLFISDYKKST